MLDISCKGQTRFVKEGYKRLREIVFPKLTALQKDGLLEWNAQGLQLTNQGHYFMRNVCSAFDLYLNPAAGQTLFSKAI